MFQNRVFIGCYVMILVSVVDQLTKWMILDRLTDVHKTVPVSSFLNFVLVWNKGVTFGMFNRGDQQQFISYILIGVALVIMFFLARWLWKTTSLAVAIALGGVMGGAVGNVIDRVQHGAVLDFLDFHYAGYHWYAFNVADACIVMGVALLLIDGMVRGK